MSEERQSFTLDTGEQGSRSAFIRQEFMKDRSRADIAKELDVPYYIVYSATANMFNAVHTAGGGKAGGSRGVMVEDPDTGEMVSRAALMRKMIEEKGMTRGEVKEHFDVPYATVYAATKDVELPEGARKGGRKMITHPDTGEEAPRTEVIRDMYGAGKTRREIADALSVDYAVVWAATKEPKEVDDEVQSDTDSYDEFDE